MNFDELCSEVATLTRRPDLINTRIPAAVKAAILKAHQSDFFYRDLREVSIEFTTPAYIQNFDPAALIPKYRKAKYIRQWNGDADGAGGLVYEAVQIEHLFDGYGDERVNVFYQAGKVLQIKSATPVDKILFGCYILPSLDSDDADFSWIATAFPYAIVYDAARVVFRGIGLAQEANDFDRLTAEQYINLKMSNVDDLPNT